MSRIQSGTFPQRKRTAPQSPYGKLPTPQSPAAGNSFQPGQQFRSGGQRGRPPEMMNRPHYPGQGDGALQFLQRGQQLPGYASGELFQPGELDVIDKFGWPYSARPPETIQEMREWSRQEELREQRRPTIDNPEIGSLGWKLFQQLKADGIDPREFFSPRRSQPSSIHRFNKMEFDPTGIAPARPPSRLDGEVSMTANPPPHRQGQAEQWGQGGGFFGGIPREAPNAEIFSQTAGDLQAAHPMEQRITGPDGQPGRTVGEAVEAFNSPSLEKKPIDFSGQAPTPEIQAKRDLIAGRRAHIAAQMDESAKLEPQGPWESSAGRNRGMNRYRSGWELPIPKDGKGYDGKSHPGGVLKIPGNEAPVSREDRGAAWDVSPELEAKAQQIRDSIAAKRAPAAPQPPVEFGGGSQGFPQPSSPSDAPPPTDALADSPFGDGKKDWNAIGRGRYQERHARLKAAREAAFMGNFSPKAQQRKDRLRMQKMVQALRRNGINPMMAFPSPDAMRMQAQKYRTDAITEQGRLEAERRTGEAEAKHQSAMDLQADRHKHDADMLEKAEGLKQGRDSLPVPKAAPSEPEPTGLVPARVNETLGDYFEAQSAAGVEPDVIMDGLRWRFPNASPEEIEKAYRGLGSPGGGKWPSKAAAAASSHLAPKFTPLPADADDWIKSRGRAGAIHRAATDADDWGGM